MANTHRGSSNPRIINNGKFKVNEKDANKYEKYYRNNNVIIKLNRKSMLSLFSNNKRFLDQKELLNFFKFSDDIHSFVDKFSILFKRFFFKTFLKYPSS